MKLVPCAMPADEAERRLRRSSLATITGQSSLVRAWPSGRFPVPRQHRATIKRVGLLPKFLYPFDELAW